MITAQSAEPLKVDRLVLRKGNRTRLLLANLTDEPQPVSLNKLGATVRVKRLDESNAARAMKSPEKYRAQAGEAMRTVKGKLEMLLLPYAIVRVDE